VQEPVEKPEEPQRREGYREMRTPMPSLYYNGPNCSPVARKFGARRDRHRSAVLPGCCIADFQSASVGTIRTQQSRRASADWKWAIQQVGNLRYFGCGFAALRSSRLWGSMFSRRLCTRECERRWQVNQNGRLRFVKPPRLLLWSKSRSVCAVKGIP
jgi:hypothetical protein